jgi:pSer/pThr/pTyr-binding forkhead associated (FHA) protein
MILGQSARIGRSAAAEVNLREQYASREHALLELTADGWAVECLSDAGLVINGKKYKKGKRILLDTGDELLFGAQTIVLYVAPGGDADTALFQYRQVHQEAASPQAQPVAAAPAAPKDTAPPPLPAAAPPEPQQPRQPHVGRAGAGIGAKYVSPAEEESADLELLQTPDEERKAKQAKYRKYAIFGGVYLVAIVGLIGFLSMARQTSRQLQDGPIILTDRQIEDALLAPLPEGRNETLAIEALRQARIPPSPLDTGDVYKRMKEYKRFVAYHPLHRAAWEDKDQAQYDNLAKRLMDDVKREYRNGWSYEKAMKWQGARDAFLRIRQLVPEMDMSDPVYVKLLSNVSEHVRWVERHIKN